MPNSAPHGHTKAHSPPRGGGALPRTKPLRESRTIPCKAGRTRRNRASPRHCERAHRESVAINDSGFPIRSIATRLKPLAMTIALHYAHRQEPLRQQSRNIGNAANASELDDEVIGCAAVGCAGGDNIEIALMREPSDLVDSDVVGRNIQLLLERDSRIDCRAARIACAEADNAIRGARGERVHLQFFYQLFLWCSGIL